MNTRHVRWTIVAVLALAAVGLLVVLFRPQPLAVEWRRHRGADRRNGGRSGRGARATGLRRRRAGRRTIGSVALEVGDRVTPNRNDRRPHPAGRA